MSIVGNSTIQETFKHFITAPIENPDLLPSLMPIILGFLIIELYFGKHESEDLGWNTSVGNAIIWLSTGAILLMNQGLETAEKYAAYFLIGIGVFVGYMDFYHKWSSTTAFLASSPGVVYSLAYITVIIIRTDVPVNETTLKASAIFLVAANIGITIIQQFETPARDNFQFS